MFEPTHRSCEHTFSRFFQEPILHDEQWCVLLFLPEPGFPQHFFVVGRVLLSLLLLCELPLSVPFLPLSWADEKGIRAVGLDDEISVICRLPGNDCCTTFDVGFVVNEECNRVGREPEEGDGGSFIQVSLGGMARE